jgi:putative FmdB family regulatory protein
MPTYTYGCAACNHRFDAFQRFADDPLTECPQCGAPIRRLIQPVGVVFKGSGWYINDSRPKASDETSAKPKTDKTDDSKATTPAKDSTGDKAAATAPVADKAEKPAPPKKAAAVAAD